MQQAQPEARPKPTGPSIDSPDKQEKAEKLVSSSPPSPIEPPDYVITVKLSGKEDVDITNTKSLVHALSEYGFTVKIRRGSVRQLLVLVHCSDELVRARAVAEITKEWTYGTRTVDFDPNKAQLAFQEAAKSISDADRLRIIYDLITCLPDNGGAGIRIMSNGWPFVEAIFPVHDPALKKEWAKRLASATLWGLRADDLEFIRSKFGAKVGLYFAFVQFYFMWSLVPTVIGIVSYLWTNGEGSDPVFAVIMAVWSLVFVQAWHRRQSQLAIQWKVAGAQQFGQQSLQFKGESTVEDPITGQVKAYYPGWKRAARQLCFVPLALGSVALLVACQTAVLGYEIFITQIYDGPFKSVLGLTPALVLTVIVIVLTTGYNLLAKWFNQFENYETVEAEELGFTLKQFIFNFFVAYMPLFLSAYLYLPFGSLIQNYLEPISANCNRLARREVPIVSTFELNTLRLRQQVIYFAVTAQFISFGTETVLPFVLSKIRRKEDVIFDDTPTESDLLDAIRHQLSLPAYSVHEDYRQLVVQFGYTCLFAVIWPLSPLAATINLWVQMRGDAAKICFDTQRPVPRREESIGPWENWLHILSQIGGLTSASLVAMNNGFTSMAAVLGISFLVDKFYSAIYSAVHVILNTLPTSESIEARRKGYDVRRRAIYEMDSGTESTGPQLPKVQGSLDQEIARALKPLKTLAEKKSE